MSLNFFNDSQEDESTQEPQGSFRIVDISEVKGSFSVPGYLKEQVDDLYEVILRDNNEEPII